MESLNNQIKGENLFVGIDLHKHRWRITIRTADVEIFSSSIVGRWDNLRRLLDRYKGCRIHAVYEAGCFGFWLFNRLNNYGVCCIVTPPSLVPQEHGNRVKTDRRDSRKLARLLAKELLKNIWVPSPEERFHRQVIRRRHQLVGIGCEHKTALNLSFIFMVLIYQQCEVNVAKCILQICRGLNSKITGCNKASTNC